MGVFWDAIPCTSATKYQDLEENRWFCLHTTFFLISNATCFSTTLMHVYQTTRRQMFFILMAVTASDLTKTNFVRGSDSVKNIKSNSNRLRCFYDPDISRRPCTQREEWN